MHFATPPRRVSPGSVHLRRILAGEGPAAVPGHPAVGVDDDLASGEARVSRWPPYHEAPRRVDVPRRFLIQQVCRDHCLDHVPLDVRADLLGLDIVRVLRRDDDRRHPLGRAVCVLHRHLGFAVWTEVGQCAAVAHRREPPCEPVRERES